MFLFISVEKYLEKSGKRNSLVQQLRMPDSHSCPAGAKQISAHQESELVTDW